MDGLRRFGITDSSTSLIAIKVVKIDNVTTNLESSYALLTQIVAGTELDVNDLNIQKHCDLELLKKNYKLGKSVNIEDPWSVNAALVGAITLRGS